MSIHVGEAPRARPRILVVDDEPHIRGLVARALAAAGYLIEDASDGTAGLEKALTNAYQLVILDLVMPLTDGRQVLSKLRQERPEQPILILSCLSDVTTKVGCLDSGAQDYLSKPFSLDELLARVRVQLRGEHHATESHQ